MINLLPPEVKNQVTFSQHNRTVSYYIWLLIILIILIGSSYVGVWLYMNNQISKVNDRIAEQQAHIDSYKGLETKAKQLADRLGAIDKVQKERNKFSILLADIAKLTPKNVYIFSITIGEEAGSPVKILAYGENYATAVSLRDSLASSSRFANVDISDVNQDTDPYNGKPNYRINLVAGLKSGAIK